MSAVNLMALKPVLEQRGGSLVAIAPDAAGLDDFVSDTRFTDNIHTDEKREAYRALELRTTDCSNCWGCCICCNSVGTWYSKASKQGYKNDMSGSFTQYGGTFLVSATGQVLYAHRQTAEDFEPSVPAMLEALGAADDERHAVGEYPEPTWIK